MKTTRKKRLSKMVFAINAFVFLMGAMTFISSGKYVFGIIQLIARASEIWRCCYPL